MEPKSYILLGGIAVLAVVATYLAIYSIPALRRGFRSTDERFGPPNAATRIVRVVALGSAVGAVFLVAVMAALVIRLQIGLGS
jgi:hypothetical protein